MREIPRAVNFHNILLEKRSRDSHEISSSTSRKEAVYSRLLFYSPQRLIDMNILIVSILREN